MCDLTATYTTVLAAGDDLNQISEQWFGMRTVRRYRLAEVDVATLRHLGHHWNEHSPVVLTVHHDHMPGHLVANELQVELSVDYGCQVMCEPGYPVGLAAGPFTMMANGGDWTVDLDQDALESASQWLAGESSLGQGRRVAVIDSGADTDLMLDMVNDTPKEVQGEDQIGHGTAIARLIRKLRPNAEIHPIRVLRTNPGESRHLLLGLLAALSSDEHGNALYDVVNISLSRQLIDECSTSLGATMEHARALCARQGTVPPVVAAAGNTTLQQEFGYPAAFPDAVAVTALDWNGQLADYNVDVPEETTVVESAYGGIDDKPFGTLSNGGPAENLYGTSLAAALVTCRYLAP